MNSKIKIKIITLGDSGTGKSSILQRYVNNCFCNKDLPAGVGASILVKEREYHELPFKFEIWDTAGSEQFQSVTSQYYRGSKVVILVYDVTKGKSFESLGRYLEIFREVAGDNAFFIIAGNKTDLLNSGCNEVPFRYVQIFAKENNCEYVETSAKTGEGIEELFNRISQYVFNQHYQKEEQKLIELKNIQEKKKKSWFGWLSC